MQSAHSITDQNFLFKILVVGCAGVGKTTCIRKLVYNTFTNEYKVTIGVDFAFKIIKIEHNGKEQPVRLQLWDIAGQERNNQLLRCYYKDAYGCIVVGDLDTETLKNDVKSWKTDIDAKVQFPEAGDKLPCICLCNKIDKAGAREKFTEAFKQDLGDLGFDAIFGTSASTGEGLAEALERITRLILEKAEKCGLKPGTVVNKTDLDGIVNPGEEDVKKKKLGCC